MKRCFALILSLTLATAAIAAPPVAVKPYTKSNGEQIGSHYRTSPDRIFNNNWSTKPNINPYTGQRGTRVTPPANYKGVIYVPEIAGPPYYSPATGVAINAVSAADTAPAQTAVTPELPPPPANSDYYIKSTMVDLPPIARAELKLRDVKDRSDAASRIEALGISDVRWQSMDLPDLLSVEIVIGKTEESQRQTVFNSLRDFVYAKSLIYPK